MSDDTSVTITNNEAQGRYEARVDGELAGILEYQLGEGTVLFPHTEVHPQFGGRGIGAQLASRAVREAADKGLSMIPACRFVRGWIDKHPEFAGYVK